MVQSADMGELGEFCYYEIPEIGSLDRASLLHRATAAREGNRVDAHRCPGWAGHVFRRSKMRREMRKRRSRPQRLPARSRLLVGAAVVFLALVAAGCGAQQSPAIPLFGPFAGYSWHGSVQRGQCGDGRAPDQGLPRPWRCRYVDRSRGTHQSRHAGCAVLSGRGQRGVHHTTEQLLRVLEFNRERFRPLWLLSVDPGDVVQLSMHANGDHWVMSARDETFKCPASQGGERCWSIAIGSCELASGGRDRQRHVRPVPLPEAGRRAIFRAANQQSPPARQGVDNDLDVHSARDSWSESLDLRRLQHWHH